jgi:hypothetical protein
MVQVPEFEELKACIKAIKEAHPDMGISKVHKAVKEQNPTWQVLLFAKGLSLNACLVVGCLGVTNFPRRICLSGSAQKIG